ncbi:MAG: hypothetical protein H6882_11800 [Rhodobiaceae bacterium]|nr:hypothetical protein [Rhodobiaceae bacterium]
MSNFHWDHMRGSSGDSSAPGWGGYLGHEKHRQQQDRERFRRSSEAAERLHGSSGGGGSEFLSEFNVFQQIIICCLGIFVVAPFVLVVLTTDGGWSHIEPAYRSSVLWAFGIGILLFLLVTPAFWMAVVSVLGLGAAQIFATGEAKAEFHEEFTSGGTISETAGAAFIFGLLSFIYLNGCGELLSDAPLGTAPSALPRAVGTDEMPIWIAIFLGGGVCLGLVGYHISNAYWKTIGKLEPRLVAQTSPRLNKLMSVLAIGYQAVFVFLSSALGSGAAIGLSIALAGHLLDLDTWAILERSRALLVIAPTVIGLIASIMVGRKTSRGLRQELALQISRGTNPAGE